MDDELKEHLARHGFNAEDIATMEAFEVALKTKKRVLHPAPEPLF